MDQQPGIEEEVPIEGCESSSLPTQGRSNEHNTWHRSLHEAVVRGNWNETKSFIDSHPGEALSARLSMGETILHTAIIHNHVQLVVELVKTMSMNDLEIPLPYRWNSTSLHLAVDGGNVKIAVALVERNKNLLFIPDDQKYLPVTKASYSTGKKDMLHYLYLVTQDNLNHSDHFEDGITILINTIIAEEYGFALKILEDHPQLLTAQNSRGTTALEMLARMPSAFPSGNKLGLCQTWIYKCCFF